MLWQHSFLGQRSILLTTPTPRRAQRTAAASDNTLHGEPDTTTPGTWAHARHASSHVSATEDNRLLIRRLKQSLAPKRPRDTTPLLRPKLASGATPLHNAEGWDSDDEDPPPSPPADTLRAARAVARAPTISAARERSSGVTAVRTPPSTRTVAAAGTARQQARSRTHLLGVGVEDDEGVQDGGAAMDDDAIQVDAARAHYAAILEDDDIIGLGTMHSHLFALTPCTAATPAPLPGVLPPVDPVADPVADDSDDDYAVQAEIDALALELSDGEGRVGAPDKGAPATLQEIAAFLVEHTGMESEKCGRMLAKHPASCMHRAHACVRQSLSHAEAFSSSYQWLPVIGRNTQFVYQFLCTLGMAPVRAPTRIPKKTYSAHAQADIGRVLATNTDFLRRNTRSMVERLAYLQWVGIPPSMWALIVKKHPRSVFVCVSFCLCALVAPPRHPGCCLRVCAGGCCP